MLVTDEMPAVPRMAVSETWRRGKSVWTRPLLVAPSMVNAALPGSVRVRLALLVAKVLLPGASEPLKVSVALDVSAATRASWAALMSRVPLLVRTRTLPVGRLTDTGPLLVSRSRSRPPRVVMPPFDARARIDPSVFAASMRPLDVRSWRLDSGGTEISTSAPLSPREIGWSVRRAVMVTRSVVEVMLTPILARSASASFWSLPDPRLVTRTSMALSPPAVTVMRPLNVSTTTMGAGPTGTVWRSSCWA